MKNKKRKKDNKKYFLLFCILVSLVLITITCIRAYITNITYDEGFTYMHYIYGNPFKVFTHIFIKNTWANNHLLNSFLVSIVQLVFRIEYNEFLIRLPNILFYILYFIISYNLCKSYKYKYFSFSLLTLNYGLNEFGGLARGYGIASTLVLLSLYYFNKYKNDNNYKNLNLTYISLMASCYANTSSLIVYMSLFIVTVSILIKNKIFIDYIKKNIIYIIPIFIGTLLVIKYHFMVSSEGLPLYGGNSSFYNNVIKDMFLTYGLNTKLINIIINLFIGLLIVMITKNYKKLKTNKVIISCIGFFVLLYIITKVTGKPWMTGRTLLPSMSLIILSIVEIFESFNIKKSNVFETLVCISLILLFISNVDIHHTRDWFDNYNIRRVSYNAYKTKNNNETIKIESNCAAQFYREKILKQNNYDIFIESDKK